MPWRNCLLIHSLIFTENKPTGLTFSCLLILICNCTCVIYITVKVCLSDGHYSGWWRMQYCLNMIKRFVIFLWSYLQQEYMPFCEYGIWISCCSGPEVLLDLRRSETRGWWWWWWCCRLEIEIEPIFASMALYNMKERKKVSENFYFDMMSPPVKKMLETHVPFEDDSSLSRSCIFHLSHPSPDLFLVIRVLTYWHTLDSLHGSLMYWCHSYCNSIVCCK